MQSNEEFLDWLNPPLARFYLADLHVHSVGSAAACIGSNFDALPGQLHLNSALVLH